MLSVPAFVETVLVGVDQATGGVKLVVYRSTNPVELVGQKTFTDGTWFVVTMPVIELVTRIVCKLEVILMEGGAVTIASGPNSHVVLALSVAVAERYFPGAIPKGRIITKLACPLAPVVMLVEATLIKPSP